MTDNTVAVVGAGTIGRSLALAFALAGFDTHLIYRRHATLRELTPEMQRGAMELAEAGLLPASAANWQDRLRYGSDLRAGVSGAEVVVEAIAEDLSSKQSLFATIEPWVDPSTLLASTTSGLPADSIGVHLSGQQRFVVMHFANPPHLMPLVEVVPGTNTSSATVDRACRLVEELGKSPIRLSRDIPGHIFNRLQFALFREALALVRDGIATPAEVDAVVKKGYALRLAIEGPFEKADLSGIPLMSAIAHYLFPTLDNSDSAAMLDAQIASGLVGAKSGSGFYDWNIRDPDAAIRQRNAEVIRHLQRLRGAKHS